MTPSVMTPTRSGMVTARAVAAEVGGVVEAPGDSWGDALRAAFRAGTPIVGVCASGILIRALAPILGDKHAEPPVLAVSPDGASVVPLLGGHRGANGMAREIAAALGGHAAVTTASEHALGVALDDPPAGWTLANPDAVKGVTAALLNGAGARREGALPWAAPDHDPAGSVTLRGTTRAGSGDAETLIYHPAALAVGVGCARGADPDATARFVRDTLAARGLTPPAVGVVVSLDLKADEAAVHAVAADFGVPARFFDAATLDAEHSRLHTPSRAVYRTVGCHGVAEGAALAAAGPDGELVVAKHRAAEATCAVAEAPTPIRATAVGRARGGVTLVGLGPGGAGEITHAAGAALAHADELVGYGGYLDLIPEAAPHARRHRFALGAEHDRARAALDLAAEGRTVALACSGDPGVYAMASPLLEAREASATPAHHRIALDVAPGISAMQAAAARLGAPLGHDVAAISLSDLLTPWAVIARRLEAAGAGDMVVALYNPISKRRTWQLAAARDILLQHRPPTTPVGLAHKLGRPGETVASCTLGELTGGEVDMHTLVLVGSSRTRVDAHGALITPRAIPAREDAS